MGGLVREGLPDSQRRLEVHVRHPQRQRILFEQVPLHARRVPARDDFIKIELFHSERSEGI